MSYIKQDLEGDIFKHISSSEHASFLFLRNPSVPHEVGSLDDVVEREKLILLEKLDFMQRGVDG